MRSFYTSNKWFQSVIQTRDQIYKNTIVEGKKQEIQWIIPSVFFLVSALLFAFLGTFFLIHKSDRIVTAVACLWIALGLAVLDISILIVIWIDLNSYKGKYYFNAVYFIIIVTNLPVVILFSYISASLNKNDIDLDTYFLPFNIIPVDYLILILGLQIWGMHANKFDEVVKEHQYLFVGCDMNAIMLLIFILIAMLII